VDDQVRGRFRIVSLDRLRRSETAERVWYNASNDEFFALNVYVRAATGQELHGYHNTEEPGALERVLTTLDLLERIVDEMNNAPELVALAASRIDPASSIRAPIDDPEPVIERVLGGLSDVAPAALLDRMRHELRIWAAGMSTDRQISALIVFSDAEDPIAIDGADGQAAGEDEQATKAATAARDAARRVQLRMLSDAPIDDDRLDLLHHGDYADALTFLIDHPSTGTPLTIAINAPWGAGKTSLAKLTERRLLARPLRTQPAIVCWFNAWHHDDAPNMTTALAATVARCVAPERSLFRRVCDPLPSSLLTVSGRRRRWLWLSAVSVLVALAMLWLAGGIGDLTRGGATAAAIVTALPLVLQQIASVRGTASEVSGLLRSSERSLTTGSLREVSDDIGELVHQATRRRGWHRQQRSDWRRVVVFIDDIERCQPPRAIEVCEAVTQLLAHEDVVVVLLGDMRTIAVSADVKYKDLAAHSGNGAMSATSSFGELYLDKIVQFRFDMPAHDPETLRRLADELLRSATDSTSANPAPVASASLVPWWAPVARRLTFRGWRDRQRHRRDAGRTAAALDNPEVEEFLAANGDETDAAELADALVTQFPWLAMQDHDRLGRAAMLRVVDGPEYLERAYDAVRDHVRPLPRDTKRLLNRMRFLLSLAIQRDLLRTDSALDVDHLAKWALLTERWPNLVAAVVVEPGRLGEFEAATNDAETLAASVAKVAPGVRVGGDLQRLLASSPPLASVCKHLVQMREPSDPSRPAEAAAG
jgi:hypothetical protein